MASSLPRNPNDDDLESVAESLLGIDFSGAAAIPDSIELDDDDLFAEEPEETPVTESGVSESQPPIAEPETAPVGWSAPDEEDDDSDFGFGLDIEDELEDVSFADEPVRPAEAAREERYVEPEPEPVSESEGAPVMRGSQPQDDFWDALEGWDWGDEEKGSKSSAGARSRDRDEEESPAPRPREAERAVRPAPRREEAVDDDFGAGLLEDRDASRSSREREPDERVRDERPRRETGREGRPRESRPESAERRGGRERPRRGDRPAREERPAPAPRPEPEAVAFDDEDAGGFGEGLDLETPASTERASREREEGQGEERRGRRRGRGRGRGRDRDRESRTPEPAADLPPRTDDLDFDSQEPFAAEEEQAASEPDTQETRFQDVPTWEEAISYLVRPRAKSASSTGSASQSESGTGEGSRRSTEGDRDRPRRRGGRRGGGRRPRD